MAKGLLVTTCIEARDSKSDQSISLPIRQLIYEVANLTEDIVTELDREQVDAFWAVHAGLKSLQNGWWQLGPTQNAPIRCSWGWSSRLATERLAELRERSDLGYESV
jgi:hypothetical protein